MTNFSDIGAALQTARKAQGLSQTELARPLGMSRATISAIENGTFTDLGVRKLAAVCAAVGLELSVAARKKFPTYHELKKARDAERRT
jgi:HTH-type transcriptional regulator / antitoxin HipB